MSLIPTTKLNPSELDRLVDIETKEIVVQSNGQQVESWVTTATDVYAKVVQVSGNKVLAAQQLQIQFDYQITIRWRSGFNLLPDTNAVNSRFQYNGQTLEIIKQPAEVGRRQYLECVCVVRL